MSNIYANMQINVLISYINALFMTLQAIVIYLNLQYFRFQIAAFYN